MKEAEVCDKFKELMERMGWKVYPETSGWDLICVGHEGLQIGIEAKGRANIQVLHQALHGSQPNLCTKVGPDFHAVLVPSANSEFLHIARLLHLLCFDLEAILKREEYFFMRLSDLTFEDDRCWSHERSCWVPEVQIETPAGVPSPKRVTPWKIGAVKLCMRLDEKGFITSRDFQEFGISFTQYWRLRLKGAGRARVPSTNGKGEVWLKRFVRNGVSTPDQEFPEVLEALKKTQDKLAA